MSWPVKFFQNQRGDFPVIEFIEKLEKPLYMRIFRYIDLLANKGIYVQPSYAKKIRNDIWELRITGKIQVRILYTFFNNVFYLLHAFKKKSQKIPSKELSKALDRREKLV